MKTCHAKVDMTIFVALALTFALSLAPRNVNGAPYLPPTLVLVDRAVTQDQGAWVIDYRLRNVTRAGIIIVPDHVRLKVEGWVSNSRIASHSIPRQSLLMIATSMGSIALADVINAVDESQQCRERLAVSLWHEGQSQSDFSLTPSSVDHPTIRMTAVAVGTSPVSCSLLSLGPGEMIHLRLRIDHLHTLYGDYDPLLGSRTIELTLGRSAIRDILLLDREQYLAQPKGTWPEPPKERRDTRRFISAPDSLHLGTDIQGHQSYRYQERPVRYDTKMKLQFWYLIASGTEGKCYVRVGQNKDTPLAWRQLHKAGFEEQLKTIGRWAKYERIFKTELEATKLILEFRILGEIEIGEMWVDNVSIEPVGITGAAGP